jgi:hypothetical protein
MHNLADDPDYSNKIQLLRTQLKKEMKAAFDNLDIDLADWGRLPNQKAYGS